MRGAKRTPNRHVKIVSKKHKQNKMSLQLIFIIGNEDRKQKILQQLKDLQIPFSFYLLDASMPTNSQDYLPPEETDYNKRLICCSRSHIRAIEYASRDTSADFSVILEDDAALHKTEFVNTVTKLVKEWDILIPSHHKMVSIGWVPFKNYDNYITHNSIEKSFDTYSLIGMFFFGTQAYIIKKDTAKQYTPIFVKKTYKEFVDSILLSKIPYINNDTNLLTPDMWLNRALVQTALFPLLVIEQKENKSMLGHFGTNDNERAWKPFFEGHEEERAKYWSY
jgi:GR25 family glycosyltransferase involved in LPS biosynthesis